MGELAAHLAKETRRFVELQVELTKMQVIQGLAGGLYDALKVGVAAVLLSMGGLCFVIALALALSVLFGSYWIGTMVTGLILVVTGAIVLRIAIGTSFLRHVLPGDLLKQVRTLSKGDRDS